MTDRLWISEIIDGLSVQYVASPHKHMGAEPWVREAEWQPIETAPKDRQILMAWDWAGLPRGGFQYGVVRWSHEEGLWLEGAADYVEPGDCWQEISPPASDDAQEGV